MDAIKAKAFAKRNWCLRVGASLVSLDVDYSLEDLGEGNEDVWVSRLFVPKRLRGNGLATQAMTRMCAEADIQKVVIGLCVNPYGDLGYWGLVNFYVRFGFQMTSHGSMVRYPSDSIPTQRDPSSIIA